MVWKTVTQNTSWGEKGSSKGDHKGEGEQTRRTTRLQRYIPSQVSTLGRVRKKKSFQTQQEPTELSDQWFRNNFTGISETEVP